MSVLENKIVVSFEVNGRPVELLVAPNRTLLEVLREDLGLTGVKHGCDDSNCGVCTVIMDGKAVKSCSILIGQAEGTKVTTIEGLEGEMVCIRCKRRLLSILQFSAVTARPA